MNKMGIERIGGSNASLYTSVSKPQTGIGREAEAAAKTNTNEQQSAPNTAGVTQQRETREPEGRVDSRSRGLLPGEEEESPLEQSQEKTVKVKNAIAEVNKKMNQHTRCEFSYHEDTKRVSIKVIDSDTDEVVREIPPEETLDMLSKMWEVAGILVDEQR